MRKIKLYIRRAFAFFLYKSGILHYILKYRYNDKAIVLMYHRIIDNDKAKVTTQDGMYVHKKTFKQQMEFLKNNLKIIPLDEFKNVLHGGGNFPECSVLITFDDGWKDNYTQAFPILHEGDIPFVIFLTAGFINQNKSFWQTRITRALYTIREKVKRDELDSSQFSEMPHNEELISLLECPDYESWKNKLSNLLSKLKNYESLEIERFLTCLIEVSYNSAVDLSDDETEFLSWQEVLSMQGQGVDFGSHSVNHEILTRNKQSACREIHDSKRMIEEQIGKRVSSFSYPNGDYDESVSAMVKNAGYDIAFSTRNGPVTRDSNILAIPRINIHEDMTNTIPMFLCRILGLW